MSLGFQIGKEWLDMNPGTVMEMERENPFLQLGDDVVGEYSMPLTIRNTPKNNRLLKYAGMVQKRVEANGVEAKAYDTGLQHSVGSLKIERPNLHLNHLSQGDISVYYLIGLSHFNQQAKSVKLRSVDLGGDRSWPLDLSNYMNQTGPGFWAHYTAVMRAPVGAYDYAFFPVVNTESGFGEVINEPLVNINPRVYAEGGARVPIVPFPYLKGVLEKAVAHCGWRIVGDVLNDPAFAKICIINSTCIDYGTYDYWHRTVTFNLRDHVPDWTVPEFLINLRKRMGWWYDFDHKAKIIRVRPLSDVVGNTIKEMTRYANPMAAKKVAQQKTVYGLKNNFSGSYDGAAVDFKKLKVQGEVFLKSSLPAATEARHKHTYLVVSENNWYVCRTNEAGTIWGWYLLQYNCLDVVPEAMTQEITTSCTTLGMEYRNSYLDLVPRMDAPLTWGDEEGTDTTMPLLFYHGHQPNKTGQLYPYASSHPYNSAGTQLTDWSLAFECKLSNGDNVGLYHRNWKALLDTFISNEELEVKLNLPRAEFMKLKFSDIISITGVRMYIRKMKHQLPYNGVVQLECVRI